MEKMSAPRDFCAMKKPSLEAHLPIEMRPERVGRRLTALRETLRLNKSQLADSIGLDRSALTKIEKGQEGLGLNKAGLIAELYGFGFNYLYRGDLTDTPEELRTKLLAELHIAGALPPRPE